MWTPLALAASCDSLCSYLKSLAAEPWNLCLFQWPSWRELGTFIDLNDNKKHTEAQKQMYRWNSIAIYNEQNKDNSNKES